jgi:hypothetical protein
MLSSCCVAAGVIWCGGYDFDNREPELAFALTAICAAGFLGPLMIDVMISESKQK